MGRYLVILFNFFFNYFFIVMNLIFRRVLQGGAVAGLFLEAILLFNLSELMDHTEEEVESSFNQENLNSAQ